MNKILLSLLCAVTILSFSPTALSGQMLRYSVDQVTMTIMGSSSLHDWTAKCGEIIEYPQELTLDSGNDGTIESFGFKVAVTSMDGGRGSSMNEKIFKALKSEIHPYVSYIQSTPATYKIGEGGQIILSSSGVLEIAGQQKDITVSVLGRKEGDILVLSGSQAMKLSEFSIDPPSAMFGQIQTKDDIYVHFEFTYKKD